MFYDIGKQSLSNLRLPKNRAGNRTYRQKDIDIILQIKDLLYNRKFTIKGAITQFSSGEKAEEMVGQQETTVSDENNSEILVKVKQELESILDFIHKN